MAVKEVVSLLFLTYILSVSCDGNYNLKTNFLDVPIDHFTYSNSSNKFKLRYLTDNQFHVKEGPLFVYLGHEADINVFARNTGFLYDIAPTFNALIVYIEHRYYGESMPFGNETFNSTENLRYLTTSQALNDFAFVINHFKSKHFQINAEANPIIVFGGGYGANLAAWFRLKYPFLVKGAIASSASLMYPTEEKNCGKFYDKVTDVFEEFGGGKCLINVKIGWEVFTSACKNKIGREFLSQSLKLCKPIQGEEDIDKVINWVSDIYADLAAFNYPYPTDYYVPLPSYPVKIFCDKLSSAYFIDNKGFIEHFGRAIQVFTNYSGKAVCNDLSPTIGTENAAKFAWNYQTCNELIRPKCSTDSDMFINRSWNMKKIKLDCSKIFGIKDEYISSPQLTYGGFSLKSYSNVAFTNGLSDPWSVYGVPENVSSNVIVYNIDKAPHQIDIRSINYADNNYVINAREFHIESIKKWLSE